MGARVAGLLFIFVDHGAGIRRAILACALTVQRMWTKTGIELHHFIIHVNFDHAWAEHYPVTLIITKRCEQKNPVVVFCI